MSSKLIFNPFLQIHKGEEETDFLLYAPKPSDSLKTLKISKIDYPRLFETISDYFEVGINYLDTEKDLNSDEIELFIEFGVLVNEENKPEVPLFDCKLEDIKTSFDKVEFNDLIVNPTFRFEPFNLANFRSWISEKHMSPHQSTIWIKNPVTQIETGYWLTNDEAKLISEFKPNEKITKNVDEELLLKLLSAKIVSTEKLMQNEIEKWNQKLEKARITFSSEKYVLIKNLLPDAQIQSLQKFYQKYISQGFMQFGDTLVQNRFRQQNEQMAVQIHKNFAKITSLVVEDEIIPSYCYAASYKDNASLKPHRDRKQCEYSISFQVDYSPNPKDSVSPWALEIAEPFELNNENIQIDWDDFKNYSKHIKKKASLNLRCGDGLFYKGRELIHYRKKLPDNHTSTSLFFHYVKKGFEGKLT